jgi:hypothetical protein
MPKVCPEPGLTAAGARSVFEARIFDDLCFAAKAASTHP